METGHIGGQLSTTAQSHQNQTIRHRMVTWIMVEWKTYLKILYSDQECTNNEGVYGTLMAGKSGVGA
jgi:hypothetical protein